MKKDLNYNGIELLAPAGSPGSLDAALGEGADAIYLGLHDFNARMRAKNFSYNQFDAIVDKVHGLGKKVYVTLNTVFEEWERNRVYPLLKYLSEVGPDGVIVQDFGMIKIVKDNFPALQMAASTQMNVASVKAVNLLSKYNVKRVVLSRELSFEELKDIRSKTSSELEIFAHGSLCVSYSGLCLFSSYFGGKSANRGKCTQACRRYYTSDQGKKGYFFSPSDLMLIEHVPDLMEIGINSLKLEGRMKNSFYVANIVRAYRNMIDNCMVDKETALRKSLEILQSDFARNKTKYFFLNNDTNYIEPASSGEIGLFIGKIKEIKIEKSKTIALISTKESLLEEDTIRIHNEEDKVRKSVKIEEIKQAENGYWITIPEGFEVKDSVYLIERKEEKVRYPHIIPNSLTQYKRHPGINPAPQVKKRNADSGTLRAFKDGIYVKTNNLNDIYLFLSTKPEKIIFSLGKKNTAQIKKNINSLPLNRDEIILSFPAYFLASEESDFLEDVKFFVKNGFKHFIVNNLGQISVLKEFDVNVIAGPFLYVFNKYSLDFLMENGCDFFISPYENNKKNLFEVAEFFHKSFFITIFNYPELFQIKADLVQKYNFSLFSDNMKNKFHLLSNEYQSIVIPEKPFSIIDKIPQLTKAGFGKFIVDLSNIKLNKNYYKTIMKKVEQNNIIETAARFNWKDGFYRDDAYGTKDKKD
jgi:U32 family peptidase